ncbi:glutamine--fructose-6-phosphate transaminase (isomerizing) [Deferribacterales bacterium RsTz2092]|nr:glutamine--fructose-6-phosphate aminotransferase [isomerizing] [Deferribacterales bacterium]
MCGVVGYVGTRNAVDTIISGLSKLEYRGYDSAGVAVPDNGDFLIVRAVGKLDNLRKALKDVKTTATAGIGHTRWATHGKPSETNAHPHKSTHIALVHNGIIENFSELKTELLGLGYKFSSDTDTEVLAHLTEEYYKTNSLLEAVRLTAARARGSYALTVMSAREPDKIVATRRDAPLLIGIGSGEYMAASDIPAALDITRDFIRLEENDLAELTRTGVKLVNKDGRDVHREPFHVDWEPEMAEKGGFDTFMLKEIYEQPRTIVDTMRGKIVPDEGKVFFGEFDGLVPSIDKLERIVLLGCGTSWHSSLLGKLFIEKYAHISVEVDTASEFSHRELPLNKNVLVIGVSQSGETADTRNALRLARARGAVIAAICNVVGSSISSEADYVIYTHAGPEISVASTKAFTSQALTLFLLALWLGEKREKVDSKTTSGLLLDLLRIPDKIKQLLDNKDEIKRIAEIYKDTKNFMYIGRNFTCPIALEGALKLKEISYIHAEAYPAGELKHGPIALLDDSFPVMIFAPDIKVQEKIFSNMQEVKARGAKVIGVFSERNRANFPACENQIFIPDCDKEEMTTFLTTIVAQLFAYYSAQALDKDVDKPRNLAKSVTVE